MIWNRSTVARERTLEGIRDWFLTKLLGIFGEVEADHIASRFEN
jgi:hypothetical protein